MALERYRAKRHFDVTAEPRGKKGKPGGHAFVIQKHAARRLHYDLRLELDGVMKSWAITRGPSLDPGEKRLAVHVEDHPIEYNDFEGTIPQGEYGGGTVMIWDRGRWIPEGDPHRGYSKGHLEFRLEGEKLKGRWHLVRMKQRQGERQEPWLLIKGEDAQAQRGGKDILADMPLSVASGRSMEEIAAGRPVRKRSARRTVPAKAVWSSARGGPLKEDSEARSKRPAGRRAAGRGHGRNETSGKAARAAEGKAAPLPDFVPPSLAQLAERAPDSEGWVHEIKFDGYRVQARIKAGIVQIKTRRGLDWTDKFRPVAEALSALDVDGALIDGEIVVEQNGRSNFSALQEALSGGTGDLLFYVFDLLHLDGRDVKALPLVARKALLEDLIRTLPKNGTVRFSEHFETKGSVLLRHACEMQLEGIVSKRRDAPYRSGRNGDWIKTKCSDRQEFVIAGFAPATNDPRAVGALVLGYYGGKTLHYAGRVGTGFTRKTARDLFQRLDPLRRARAPFKLLPAEERSRPPVWVEPRLVAEVDFRGWTHGARLRHPSFKGLRLDKAASEVVLETKTMLKAAPTQDNSTSGSQRPSQKHSRGAGDVPLTHPERVYWEDIGLTKQGLSDYYTRVWDWIAPHLVGRVLSLVRCPEGTSGQCFFQKHASAGLDAKYLRLVPEDGDHVIAIDDLPGLVALVQAGVLELHVRGSTIEHLDKADRIVFDLDPAPDVKWGDVVRAARDVRERLEALKLAAYVKTTGGKGLHVVVPLDPTPWEDVKAFTRAFAFAMAADSPDRYIATASKRARSGRVFIDYLRNSREATAICAYSTRARPGAPVSVPIAWGELGSVRAGNQYTVENISQRLSRLKRDPWADMPRKSRPLPGLPPKR